MASPPDSLSARLEDRADLLESARLRYGTLRGMLDAFFWRDRVRAHFELLREVAQAQPEVESTLASLKRRAAAEGWPRDASPVKLMSEVERLREAVERLVLKRLPGAEASVPLAEALLRLEEVVLEAGPLLGRRTWARALELLPRNLPELRAACAAAEVFERIFKRPVSSGAWPFDAAEVGELRRAFPLAEAALAALWGRLEHFDTSGRVKTFLERRASRAPLHVPRSGPELLLHAAFWHGVALARARVLLDERLSPLVPRDGEVPELLAWLAEREGAWTRGGGEAGPGLVASESFSEARAGLLEVAAELARLSRERPSGTWNEEAAWARLWTAARRAGGEEGADVERLRDALRLFILLRGQAQTPARLFSPEHTRHRASDDVGPEVKDLASLVRAARNAASRQE
ncbi:hypothetical protein MYSTI_00241 [Myxococcus stipitatus DSM 14675]|uniref:Uncharacterized protein n=1 Tax=Myxococcus stipitatus (strain DSM 14675 / JCM 12634 / Mx s8) TaxID=1278073 RepID=L7U154_MYXSD|nr:hypothetical protein [Myxococcus stipitatus]AGC41600.1 hypothetical protein MYSTI_00241 [Myxococcus stipitatus DSM 14675]